MSIDCLADLVECNCLYFLEKRLSVFDSLCFACGFNFLKMQSTRLKNIKNG